MPDMVIFVCLERSSVGEVPSLGTGHAAFFKYTCQALMGSYNITMLSIVGRLGQTVST